jgi:hypothetical protein
MFKLLQWFYPSPSIVKPKPVIELSSITVPDTPQDVLLLELCNRVIALEEYENKRQEEITKRKKEEEEVCIWVIMCIAVSVVFLLYSVFDWYHAAIQFRLMLLDEDYTKTGFCTDVDCLFCGYPFAQSVFCMKCCVD